MTNALLPDLITLADVYGRTVKFMASKRTATQKQMDTLFEPLEFSLAERYAAVIKTVGKRMNTTIFPHLTAPPPVLSLCTDHIFVCGVNRDPEP